MKHLFLLLGMLLGLAGCQGEPAPTAPTAVTVVATVAPTATPLPARALPLDRARPPVRLVLPEIDFAAAITPMAWQVTEVAGERQAVWQVPDDAAGWHINSAGAGGAGNVILSGHHRLGAAVFAPLARGQVKIGHQILLTDDAGQQFTYRVTQISEPLLALGASAAEQSQANTYLAPTPQAQLTLITGWPDFSDTHQIFVVAQLMEQTPSP